MKKKQLKLATFNVNGIRARLPHLLSWLEREQPDVACLQELRAASAAFPIGDLRAAHIYRDRPAHALLVTG